MPWRLFTCPVEHFAEQIFARNQNFGSFELGVQNYWTAEWSNSCSGVGNSVIHVSRETFSGKWFCFQKNISLNLFWDYGRKIPEFLGNFSPRVSKPYYTRQRTLLNKFRNNFSQEFWRKHWSGLKKLQVCQESFLPLQGNSFLGETKLCKHWGSDWKLNGCLWKNRWQICQKRIPGDKKIFLRKMKFLSKKKIGLEFIFWIRVKQDRSFLLNNSPGMSNVKSTCPETVLKKVPGWEFN